MKKLIVSMAMLFTLSLSLSVMAQDAQTPQKKVTKKECCDKTKKEKKGCCTDKAEKKSDCKTEKKACSENKKACNKNEKK